MCAPDQHGDSHDWGHLDDPGTTWAQEDVSAAAYGGGEDGALAAEEWFRFILDASPDAMLVIDQDFRIKAANLDAEQMFGYGTGELIDQPLDRLVPGRFRDQHHQHQQSFLTSPHIRRMGTGIDIVGLAKCGREIPVDISIRPLRTCHGLFACAAIRDMTRHKMAAAMLQDAKTKAEQASLSKARFLTAASHDLRQPLQAIALLKDVLDMAASDPKARSVLEQIGQSLETMSDTLDLLIDVNDFEAGTIKPAVTEFSIDPLIARVAAEFRPAASAKGVRLGTVSSGLCVRSDPRLLEQILRNLLSNAVKFTSHGKILIGCRGRRGRTSLQVWDTGIGIPKTQTGAIFGDFQPTASTACPPAASPPAASPPGPSHGLKRFGLGLSIVKGLADVLGHAVSVRSVPYEGSSFAIELPLADQPSPSLLDTSLGKGASSRRFEILVVEDDPIIRDSLRLILEHDGHRVLTAPEPMAALAKLRKAAKAPELVIVDCTLPGGISGLEMASMIRQEFHAEIPAIVLTGETPAEDLHVPDIFLLHKPANAFRIRAMLASIAQAMQNGTVKSPAAASPFEMGPGRIHFIDADQTLREHIQRHFEDIPCDIVTFSSAEAFLASLADDPSSPIEGCLVTNIAMPGMSGIDLLRQVRGRGWSLPVIIVAEDGKVETAIHAMRLGANDVIEKPFDGDDLAAAIVRCMGTHGAATRPFNDSARAKSRLSVLTERERDVMAKVIQGLPNKVIAFEHGVSQRTIEFQRRSMMTKLGVKTVPDLVRLAISARVFPL